MQLKSFRVTNFRSVNDSGEIDVARITALLGRNESGKSNLLKALHSLNPVEGFQALKPIKDFPRHRRLEECTAETQVVSSKWELDDADRKRLADVFPRGATATYVNVSRRYKGDWRGVSFQGLESIEPNESDVKAKLRKISAAVRAVAEPLDEPHKGNLQTAANTFETNTEFSKIQNYTTWAEKCVSSIRELETALAAASSELTDKIEQYLTDIDEVAKQISKDKTQRASGHKWVLDNLPKFIYLDEYPELAGHQNISEFINRKNRNQREPEDEYFDKLCKVAGLKPEELQNLISDPETRNQLVNRASAVVSNEIKRLWKDRALKVRFNVDGNYLDTLVSDPTSTYDVEVNLNERSRGFQWFFSFYITFSADTDGGKAQNAIILLDEPGLYLHAKSQSDLLRHFKVDFTNHILYSTHSPFMVPTDNLDSVRTVNISESAGTTVTNDPSGDSRTLFPLQAALGYSLAQSLFIGPNNLVVEGITDYWIMSSISEYLADKKKAALDENLTVTPAGGAQKVSYMVTLLSSEELNVVVLLDQEKDSLATKDEITKSRLASEKNIVFVTAAFDADPPDEADIEDLLDADVYGALVKESYAKELKGKTLNLNPKIPRIAKRFEAALAELTIDFHKTRPTRLFIRKMAENATSVITPETEERFARLFEAINSRFAQIERQGGTSLKPKT